MVQPNQHTVNLLLRPWSCTDTHCARETKRRKTAGVVAQACSPHRNKQIDPVATSVWSEQNRFVMPVHSPCSQLNCIAFVSGVPPQNKRACYRTSIQNSRTSCSAGCRRVKRETHITHILKLGVWPAKCHRQLSFMERVLACEAQRGQPRRAALTQPTPAPCTAAYSYVPRSYPMSPGHTPTCRGYTHTLTYAQGIPRTHTTARNLVPPPWHTSCTTASIRSDPRSGPPSVSRGSNCGS